MRRAALGAATVPSARSAPEQCDNATELTEFYSSCDIVRQPLGRQKRMTIFAIYLQNDCKREENGDACIASVTEKIITISNYKPLGVKTGQYPPTKVSSTSTTPPSFPMSCIRAVLILWHMSHAVLYEPKPM